MINLKAIKMGPTPMWLVFLWEGEIWTHMAFRDMCKEERPGEDTVKRSHLQAKERGLRRNQTFWHLNHGLFSFQNCKKNTFLWFMPLSLWYFVKYTEINKSRKTIERKKTIIQNLSSSYILMGKGSIRKHVIDDTEYMKNSPKIMQHEKH